MQKLVVKSPSLQTQPQQIKIAHPMNSLYAAAEILRQTQSSMQPTNLERPLDMRFPPANGTKS